MLDLTKAREAARDAVRQMTGTAVDDHEPLISSGLIDSLSIVKLIGRLESKLGVKVPVEQVQPDDFDSVETIVDTLERVATS